MKKGLKNINKHRGLPNYAKRNILLVSFSLILVICMTVGYSILSTNLSIGANVSIGQNNDIKVTSISNFISTSGGYEIYNREYSDLTTTFNIGLPNLDSQVSYEVTISNNTKKKMILKDIVLSSYNNYEITYLLDGINENDILESNASVTFNVVFFYKAILTTVPSITTLGSVFEFVYEEYNPSSLTYAQGDMLLNLQGITSVSNNTWVDSESSKVMTLYDGVSYDGENKYYNFLSGWGSLNEPVIPATHDFTLEVYIQTADTLLSDDEAIVAQISNTVSSDPGRFKLNQNYMSGKKALRMFANTPSVNPMYNYLNDAQAATDYLLQLVRTGNEVRLYLNGVLVPSTSAYNSFDSTTNISQGPFKIARWVNTSTGQQHYNGKVYAVRVYNRVLSDSELYNNYQMDLKTYHDVVIDNPEVEATTLAEAAITDKVVTSGNGLYNTGTNEYVYKGVSVQNYIKFEEYDEIFRIISFNSDGTAKLVSNELNYQGAFDESSNRNITDSPFCTTANTIATDKTSGTVFNGCNVVESIDYYSTTTAAGKVSNNSSSLVYLNNEYYNSLPNSVKINIIYHSFNTGFLTVPSNVSNLSSYVNSKSWSGYIGMPSVDEGIHASSNELQSITGTMTVDNWMTKMAGTQTLFWTMNGSTENTWDVWTIVENSTIAKRRASRYSQGTSGKVIKFYIKPAFYIESNLIITGAGTTTYPYIIKKNQ